MASPQSDGDWQQETASGGIYGGTRGDGADVCQSLLLHVEWPRSLSLMVAGLLHDLGVLRWLWSSAMADETRREALVLPGYSTFVCHTLSGSPPSVSSTTYVIPASCWSRCFLWAAGHSSGGAGAAFIALPGVLPWVQRGDAYHRPDQAAGDAGLFTFAA